MSHDLNFGITREEYLRDIEPTLTRPLSLGAQQTRGPAVGASGGKQLKDVEVRPKKPPKPRQG